MREQREIVIRAQATDNLSLWRKGAANVLARLMYLPLEEELAAVGVPHGVVPAHNVTLDLKNVYQTHADARRAHTEFGFLRMWSIYPAQIQPIVQAMQPDFSEVQKACDILLAAQRASWGPIQHEGDLHDRATYRYFWELVQRAHVSGQKLPDAAGDWFAA